MANPIRLCGRGLRYVRQYGPAQLYYKIMERRKRNRAEAGYEKWLRGTLPTPEEEEKQRTAVFDRMPCVSILVPAYETPEEYLREMMDSVLGQSYIHLELCIADGSPSDKVRRVVEEYAGKDSRIRYQRLMENKGISENTNAALALASGDYVGLLDHDDLLLPGALYEVVKAIDETGEAEADVLYTDEDKVSMDLSRHFQPHFKPDFNLEYLRSNNYICHFFVVKRELALKVGGFHSEYDGAQDHDFIFRCAEQAKGILHIPKILYSWRSHQASTAANPESKLYAYEAGKRAVSAHLRRMGTPGEVLSTSNYGFYRVRYFSRDFKENVPAQGILIKSLKNLNRQRDGKVVYYDKARNKFVTFSRNNMKECKEDYVLFTCVRKGRLSAGFWEELTSVCARPDVGMVCARIYDRRKHLRGNIRMQGVQDPFGETTEGLREGCSGYFHRAVLQQEILEPTDCFLVKGVLLKGLSDCTDKELCEAIRKQGYRVVYDPWAVVYEDR